MLQEDSEMSTIPPNLLDYQRRALAMRESSYIDFPAHVHLETMARCNAACNFCPYSSLERKGAKMDDSLIEKIVNDLKDIPRLHRFQLSPFKVNEPFLDTRIFDLLTYLQSELPHATITLTTNGSLINERIVERLTQFPNLGYLWVSFNDHRPDEYEATMKLPYRRTRESLDRLHKAKAEGRLPMRIVLSRVGDGTAADEDFITWVRTTYPLFEVSIFPRTNWLGQVDVSPPTAPPIACTRWFEISITATGVVAHCCADGQARYPIGNVREQHVLDIYNSPSYRRLRATVDNRLQVEPCRRCNFL
jgi:radical SAM protein with 4Fe4S-binding SPASM domain